MTAIASIDRAQCRIGRKLLLKIDQFSLHQGQHWCLFGGNGTGKSLFADLLQGKRIESNNYVSYVHDFDARKDIHVVSFEEQQRLWQRDNRLDISEYADNARDQGTRVEELIRASRRAGQQDQGLFSELVGELELEEFVSRGIRFLSSGQVRRVLIARALYAQREDIPQLIILDDPLESVDVISCEKIQSCIQRFLGPANCSLQLCRREGGILSSATHMAVMQRISSEHANEFVAELVLQQQGLIDEVRNTEEFKSIQLATPVIPDVLPAAVVKDVVVEVVEQRNSSDPLIKLQGVSASYAGHQVLRDINWSMERGHHVVIEGPNGCGKSTLLSLIDGENHMAYGQQVYLFGRLRGSGETVWGIKSRFGIVSNELHNKYVKGWRAIDVVVSGFFDSVGLYDDSGSSEAELAQHWLQVLGILGIKKSFYHELSFGQQRLLLLARAMVKSPAILILDEPCVGLDDFHRRLILGTLDVIARQTRTQLIYVSHVIGERPACINQRLAFVASEGGGFTLEQSEISGRAMQYQ